MYDISGSFFCNQADCYLICIDSTNELALNKIELIKELIENNIKQNSKA